MEMKSVSECLNFFDDMILCCVDKSFGIVSLEDISDYIIRMYNEKYNQELIAISAILSHINLIIENFIQTRRVILKNNNVF